MSYEVGQILYTILKDKQIIIPIQVVEQITVKDLSGEKTDYKFLLPNKKNQKINFEKLDNIFNDLDEVNDYIMRKTKSSIDKMIEDAIILEDTFFLDKKTPEKTIACNNEKSDIKINGDKIKINLENGQTINLIDNTNTIDESLAEKIKEENESTTT